MSFGIPLSKLSISSSSPTDVQNVQVVGGVEANVIITGSTIELKSLVTASQGGNWLVTASGDVGTLHQAPGTRDLFVTGTVTTVQGTNPWTVAGTDIDIRDLTYTSDSVTVYGDNGVALQQDFNDKLIVVDSALSGALDDNKNALSGAIAQSTATLSGAIANSGTTLSSSIASLASVNHADLLALSASISASIAITNAELLAVSGAINDTKTTLSTSLANFQTQTNTNLLTVSGSINDTKLTLSRSLLNFQSQNNTNLLNVSSSIVASQNVLSNSLAAIFNELNSGDVDIRNLTASNDTVEVYGRNLFSQTKYPLLTDTQGHLSVSQGPSGSLPWKVTLTDNSGSTIGTITSPLAVKATEAIPVVTSEAQWPTYSVMVTGALVQNNKSMLSLYHASSNDAGDLVKIQRIHIMNTQTDNINNSVIAAFELRRFTSSSSGIDLPTAVFDTMDSVDPYVIAKTNASITGEAPFLHQRWVFSTDEWAISATKIEAYDHLYNTLMPVYRYEDANRIRPITLRSGEGIHVKFVNLTTSGPAVTNPEGKFDLYLVYTMEPDVIA